MPYYHNKIIIKYSSTGPCYNPDLFQPTFWIAGRRKCGNGTFAWIPSRGVALEMPYTNWLKGEPNNLKYVEDCVHFLAPADKNLVWNDSQCNLANCFVCQVDLWMVERIWFVLMTFSLRELFFFIFLNL